MQATRDWILRWNKWQRILKVCKHLTTYLRNISHLTRLLRWIYGSLLSSVCSTTQENPKCHWDAAQKKMKNVICFLMFNVVKFTFCNKFCFSLLESAIRCFLTLPLIMCDGCGCWVTVIRLSRCHKTKTKCDREFEFSSPCYRESSQLQIYAKNFFSRRNDFE